MARKLMHFGQVAPHKHPMMGQITYWFKGSGSYLIEDNSWSFSAPAISFVPSNVVHGFKVDPASDAIVISISDDRLAAIAPQSDLDLEASTFRAFSEADASADKIATLLDMIGSEYRERGAESEKLLSGLIGVVLSLIGRLGGAAPSPSASPAVALGFALRRMIDLHYRENIPVSDYVERLATTAYLLDRAAKTVFGISVKEMILRRRLLEAKRLLLFTIRSVEDIGREIGFEDPAYFSRFFRGRTNCSPSEWRAGNLSKTAE
ncbi:AraC family transcriptional activator of pobA [Neorhizobium galegae]|nr:AraC family transcriptional activator of pobA [Neorhizobium galegae]